jgi:hypothetical protein
MPPRRERRTRDYLVRMPKDRKVKIACELVACENWRYGWDTILDERTREGREAAAWIRSGASRRDYRDLGRSADGDVTVFRFQPHQRCFDEHQTRPASWLVRDGGGVMRRGDMGEWIDDLDQHVGHLGDQLQKG